MRSGEVRVFRRAGAGRRVAGAAGALGLAAGLALWPVALGAQTIRGVVLESGTTDPIVGATVELLGADSTPQRSVTSDQRGWFEVAAGQAGRYLLRLTHLSYTAARLDSVRVGEHEIVSVMLHMGRAAIPLEELMVTARSRDRLSGFYERKARKHTGRFIDREYIDRRPTLLPSELLRMTPGIRLARSTDGVSNLITLRSLDASERCNANLFLDGLPVPQDIDMSIDDFTASELIEGVEIYEAYETPPPELPVTINNCGTVAFWSRRSAFRPLTWLKVGIAAVLGAVLVISTR